MKLITDDFYENPDSLRDLALGLEFSSRARNFPGQRSTRTLIPTEAKKAFSSILKIKIDSPENRIPYNGCFQLMCARDFEKAYVHVDSSANWAAIVYLSKKIVPEGGTRFYEHKLTGLKRYPDLKDLSKTAESLDLTGEELAFLLREDRKKKSKWREIDRIGFVYNRFVLYDAQLFHQNGKTWGNSISNGRLTHNFFV
jgi:hypothetical protein